MSDIKYIIGIDEAGRGPIAGPVAVGACMVSSTLANSIDEELIEEFMRGKLKDSKKLSEKKRAEIFTWMQIKQEAGQLRFVVSMGAAKTIDSIGIVPTINKALAATLTKLKLGGSTSKFGASYAYVKILLDGGLRAPEVFKHQETIVRGDEREVVISLASIAAKVTRDEYMKRLGEKYKKEGKDYGFERHKGYGTKAHYEAIGEYGLCKEHRRSFCKSIK